MQFKDLLILKLKNCIKKIGTGVVTGYNLPFSLHRLWELDVSTLDKPVQ